MGDRPGDRARALSDVEVVPGLRRPANVYTIRLVLSIRHDEPGNSVAYTVFVEPANGGLYLVEKKGSTRVGSVTMTLRVRPARGARAIVLELGGEDPVGNVRWSSRRLKLPR